MRALIERQTLNQTSINEVSNGLWTPMKLDDAESRYTDAGGGNRYREGEPLYFNDWQLRNIGGWTNNMIAKFLGKEDDSHKVKGSQGVRSPYWRRWYLAERVIAVQETQAFIKQMNSLAMRRNKGFAA